MTNEWTAAIERLENENAELRRELAASLLREKILSDKWTAENLEILTAQESLKAELADARGRLEVIDAVDADWFDKARSFAYSPQNYSKASIVLALENALKIIEQAIKKAS